MWGFLYSPSFGPIEQIFGCSTRGRRSCSARATIFYGLLNVVTWQWAGYYMIIIYAALQGIDSDALRGGADRRRQRTGRSRCGSRSRWSRSALILILVFALIGTLQFFTEPQILRPIAQRHRSRPDFTPNIYAYQPGVPLRTVQLRVGDLVRARARGVRRRLHLHVRHPQARGASSHERPLRAGGPATPSGDTLRCMLAMVAAGDLLPRPVLVADRGQHQGRRRACSPAPGALWFAGTSTFRQPRATCSPTTAASTCAGSATRLLYAFAGGIGAHGIGRCSPATASPSTASAAAASSSRLLLGSVMVPLTALVIPTFVLMSQRRAHRTRSGRSSCRRCSTRSAST